jgi:hypothetical protein
MKFFFSYSALYCLGVIKILCMHRYGKTWSMKPLSDRYINLIIYLYIKDKSYIRIKLSI